jgi:hypothetical protein
LVLLYIVPEQPFAAVFRDIPQQPPKLQQTTERQPTPDRSTNQPAYHAAERTKSRSVSSVNSSISDMFKVATVVQQIMTKINGAVSEEDKIAAITKIVINLMKQNGR